jgi:hypothetical protein
MATDSDSSRWIGTSSSPRCSSQLGTSDCRSGFRPVSCPSTARRRCGPRSRRPASRSASSGRSQSRPDGRGPPGQPASSRPGCGGPDSGRPGSRRPGSTPRRGSPRIGSAVHRPGSPAGGRRSGRPSTRPPSTRPPSTRPPSTRPPSTRPPSTRPARGTPRKSAGACRSGPSSRTVPQPYGSESAEDGPGGPERRARRTVARCRRCQSSRPPSGCSLEAPGGLVGDTPPIVPERDRHMRRCLSPNHEGNGGKSAIVRPVLSGCDISPSEFTRTIGYPLLLTCPSAPSGP